MVKKRGGPFSIYDWMSIFCLEKCSERVEYTVKKHIHQKIPIFCNVDCWSGNWKKDTDHNLLFYEFFRFWLSRGYRGFILQNLKQLKNLETDWNWTDRTWNTCDPYSWPWKMATSECWNHLESKTLNWATSSFSSKNSSTLDFLTRK